MSTKTKNIGGRTAPQRTQTKHRVTTSDRKQESIRNEKEKTEEKKSKNDPNKTKTNVSKEDKEKTRDPKLTKRSAVAKPQTDKAQSKRIVKTQYFPSKNNYSELLKHLGRYEVGSGDAKNKKGPQRETSSDSMSATERPRTSTLRKGSIVNENIAGPEIPKKPSPTEEPKEKEEEYEDDFDSYESDFENVSSSESTANNLSEISTESTSSSSGEDEEGQPSVTKDVERKLDSGNFDLKEDKTKRDFTNLQDLVEKDNVNFNKRPESHTRSNLTSLSDEGFEEARSLQFLNFVSAKRRNDRRKSLESRKKRGEELLNMIKLDVVNFTIFDMPPVPYEDFIRAFGNSNSIQIGIQTGEELIHEEAQTETVETEEKWIQMPPKFSKVTSGFKFDKVGAGPPSYQTLEEETPQFNEHRLNNFLSKASSLVLEILKGGKTQRNGNVAGDSLSRAVVNLKPPSEFSGRRRVTRIVPNGRDPRVFLSVHVDKDGDGFSKSMVYLWDVNEAKPEAYLACHGKIGSCCFGKDARTVFAGLENGSLVAWDTSQNANIVKKVCSMIEGDVYLRFPTFLTDIEKSHCCSVVAIQCVMEDGDHRIFHEVESTWKIFSLDQEGTIAIWSVMADKEDYLTQNGGGGMKLLKNFEVNLRKLIPDLDDLSCNDMFVSNSSMSFVATNYGNIVQCDLNREKNHVKIHSADVSSPVKCLAPCPFSDVYFLAGFENGSINLYSRKISEPLMKITNKNSKNMDESIDEIRWSLEKPCVFYTKNSGNVVDAWDLSKSSVFPIESLRFEEEITCLRLGRCKMDQSYMVTSTESTINIHFLNQEHKRENDEEYIKEMKTFLTYVNRL